MSLLVSDRALLDAFRRGEKPALAAVYTHYAEQVAKVLAGGFSFMSGSKSCRFQGFRSRFDLEDVLHEVFLRAFSEKARQSYDGLSPYRNYLLGIARSVVIDEFRAQNRRAMQLVTEADPNLVAAPEGGDASDPMEGEIAASGNPVRDVENRELAEIMGAFRKTLSRDEEEVFRLRFVEGKSLAEVEAATGRSPSKVKTLEKVMRQRALETLLRSGYLEGWREKESRGWIARLVASFVEVGGGKT